MSSGIVAIVSMELLLVMCLYAANVRVKRVVGGKGIQCGARMEAASLRNATTLRHLCGATVLSPNFALTAAHCLRHKPDDYVLKLDNYCVGDNQTSPSVPVVDILHHTLYDHWTGAHDIALMRIRLADDITWSNDSILPESSFGLSGVCTIYGYGVDDLYSNKTSDILKAANVTIVSLDDCLLLLGPYVAPKHDSGMMCAAGDGTDSCQGDSGSPLVCDGRVHGVSSAGMGCGVAGLPAIYTSIGAHLQWIREVIHKYTNSNIL